MKWNNFIKSLILCALLSLYVCSNSSKVEQLNPFDGSTSASNSAMASVKNQELISPAGSRRPFIVDDIGFLKNHHYELDASASADSVADNSGSASSPELKKKITPGLLPKSA